MGSTRTHRPAGAQAWLGLITALAVLAASIFFWSEARADTPDFTARASIQSPVQASVINQDRLRLHTRPSDNPVARPAARTPITITAPGLPAQLAGGVIMLAALIWLIANRERRLW